jgi:serine/threonine protein kinase
LTPERWQQISRIFKSAISLESDARAAYLEGQCGVDESLREEVEKLLESHQKASGEKFINGVAAEDNAELLVADDHHDEPHPRLSKDQQLGSYMILDTLGVGGMGEVYLAKDSRLGRTVALKVLSEDIASDKRRMQRFSQEAKIASSLNQPNILTIFEFGEIDGMTFLATEFIDGETLRDSLRGKRLEIAEVIDIAIQVLAALDAAHEARIVHRDIKPENVMIRRRDRVVKVLDFGLAKVAERKQSILTDQYSELEAATEFKTAPHTVMGTVNYMSPEQAQAKGVDERTDIWSTGVMIYEMVSGLLPFKGATVSHTIVQILEKDPVPLTQLRNRKAPAELQRIVSKALAKNPDERYQTAKDMMIDLRTLKRYLESEAANERFSGSHTRELPAAATDPVGPLPTRHASYNKKRNSIIAAALVVIALAAIYGLKIWHSVSEQTNSSNSDVSLPTVPAVAEERTLTYWIRVQKFRDKKPYQPPFIVSCDMIFESDYRIRMNFRSRQSGHLYVLSEGPPAASAQSQFVALFPSSSANKGSSLLLPDQVVQIPEKTWFQFDEEQGTEKLWLVFSADAIAELEGLREFAGSRTGGLITDPARNQAVQNFLTTNSTHKTDAEKEEDVTTLKTAGKLLLYAVKLEHH